MAHAEGYVVPEGDIIQHGLILPSVTVFEILPISTATSECAFAHAIIRFKRNYAILRVQIYNNNFI